MDTEHPFCHGGCGRSMAVLEAAEAVPCFLAEMTSWLWWEQQAPWELHLQCGFWTSLLDAQPGVCFFSSAIDFVDLIAFSSVQSLSHVQLFVTPMDRSMTGPPVHHHLLELAQTHVHRVGDAIQPSRPLSSPFPPAFQSFLVSGSFPMSQFFASGGQSIGASVSASVPQMNIQDWFPLGSTGLVLLSKGLSRVFSSTTVQKHQFFGTYPSLWSSSHIHTWWLVKP